MKLIVGLGNPGIRYAQTKHNVGFRVIDALCEACSRAVAPTAGRSQNRLHWTSMCNALVMQATWHDSPLLLAKPMTYMNNSGTAVAALIRKFEIALPDLCVVYDDIHLDIGRLRLRQKGSDGGQNGMKSIIHHLGTTAFPRLRIGIGEPIGTLTDYVLTDWTADEAIEMTHTLERAVDALETFVTVDIQTAMNQFNRR